MTRNIAIYALAIYVAVAIGLMIDPPTGLASDRLFFALAFVPIAAALIWARWDWGPRMKREKEKRERLRAPKRPPENS